MFTSLFKISNWRDSEYKNVVLHKQNLQYFGISASTAVLPMSSPETPILWPPDGKNWPWSWERLKVGEEGDYRRWDGWMASPTAWRAAVHGVAKSQTRSSDWSDLNWTDKKNMHIGVLKCVTISFISLRKIIFYCINATEIFIIVLKGWNALPNLQNKH